VVTDPWRSLDTALKLDRQADIDHFRKRVAGASGEDVSLHEAITRFNDARARDEAADVSAVRKRLSVTRRGAQLAEGLEMIGYRLLREPDGRHRCTVVVRPQRVRRQNLGLQWRATSRASREWLRRKLGAYSGKTAFDVPPPMWKAGWLYWAEFHVEAPRSRYELHVGLEFKDSEILRDGRSHSSSFGIRCEILPEGEHGELDARAAEIAVAPEAGPQARDIGGRFLVSGCVAAREAAGRPWRTRLVIQAQDDDPPRYRWEVHGKGGFKGAALASFAFPEADEEELSRGEQRVVGMTLPARSEPGRELALKVIAPRERGGRPRFRLLEGEMGIRFPFHRLVELDAYRWLWK
jgi:hypothetical protein